jgi:hypothetical protein
MIKLKIKVSKEKMLISLTNGQGSVVNRKKRRKPTET